MTVFTPSRHNFARCRAARKNPVLHGDGSDFQVHNSDTKTKRLGGLFRPRQDRHRYCKREGHSVAPPPGAVALTGPPGPGPALDVGRSAPCARCARVAAVAVVPDVLRRVVHREHVLKAGAGAVGQVA